MVDSTLYPGEERPGYTIHYPADGTNEDLEETEIRSVLNIRELPERVEIVKLLSPVYSYLEDRITGDGCQNQYDCSHMYKMCSVAQCFNPTFACQHLTPAMVDDLAVVTALPHFVSLADLKKELPTYLALAKGSQPISMDRID